MIVKYCEYETNKGPCGNAFRVPSNQSSSQVYCTYHIGAADGGKRLRAGLVKSRNIYAKKGNEEKMREFVISRMGSAKEDAKTIADLNKRISKLEKVLEKESGDFSKGNKKKMAIVMQEQSRQPWFSAIIEKMMITRIKKLNNKIIKIEEKLERLE